MDHNSHLNLETDAIQSVYPWDQSKSDSSAESQGMQTQQGFTTPDDPESPLQTLAILTSMLSSKKCPSCIVPTDLRELVRKEVKVGTIRLNESFLLRLNDLDAVSMPFVKQLENQNIPHSTRSPNNDEQTLNEFLNYIFRKGMTALLNFLKALHEEGKNAVVKTVLELIKKRRYLEETRHPAQSGVDSANANWLPESAMSLVNVNPKIGRLHKGDRIYKMQSAPKGYVLIINNEDFVESADVFKFRAGTHVDGDRLKKLFTELGFELFQNQQFWNMKKEDMMSLVEDFSHFEGHQQVDSAVVIILSHGEDNGRIAGVDGEYISDEKIRDFFTAPACPALADKPKIFLFVACRGRNNDIGHMIPVPPGNNPRNPASGDSIFTDSLPFSVSGKTNEPVQGVSYTKIPSYADFFVVYATVPGYVSLRDVRTGTWFVDDFVNVVAEEAHKNDLAAMVCEVNNRMSERTTPHLEKQSLHVITTLRKNLFLNPGF